MQPAAIKFAHPAKNILRFLAHADHGTQKSSVKSLK